MSEEINIYQSFDFFSFSENIKDKRFYPIKDTILFFKIHAIPIQMSLKESILEIFQII